MCECLVSLSQVFIFFVQKADLLVKLAHLFIGASIGVGTKDLTHEGLIDLKRGCQIFHLLNQLPCLLAREVLLTRLQVPEALLVNLLRKKHRGGLGGRIGHCLVQATSFLF